MTMTVTATVPCVSPPAWAIHERALFDAMDAAAGPFSERYLRPDGAMGWNDTEAGRVRSDAFYEALHNWPLLYTLGGADQLLTSAATSWEAITRQLADYGQVTDELDQTQDWFHLGEGNLLFYNLCLASSGTANMPWAKRAGRFADLFTTPPHYDPVRRLIGGPRTSPASFLDAQGSYPWTPTMARYGLPYDDVPGIGTYEDLKDPQLALRMGQTMTRRMSNSDVPQNLSATTLATVAYLMTGDERYRTWVLDYVECWAARAAENGGLVPDNIGLSGVMGEHLDGRWYGGAYGWTWPHGFYNIAMAAVAGATNALLLSGDTAYLDLPRNLIDRIFDLGDVRVADRSQMSLPENLLDHRLAFPKEPRTFVIPYRYTGSGWFDYQPPALAYPATLWAASMADQDWSRLEWLRERSGYDWRRVLPFRTKEENGHEAPWLRYLAGDNDDYPEQVLRTVHGQVLHRLDLIRADPVDLATGGADKHHATGFNPIFTEALLQLTTGAPQRLYNSGLPLCQVVYADPQRGRPGLPPDVGALVTTVTDSAVGLSLVNLSGTTERDVVIRAGAYAEHRFTSIHYDALEDPTSYPGGTGYGGGVMPRVSAVGIERSMDASELLVHLPPGRQITLDLGTRRYAARPSLPWTPR